MPDVFIKLRKFEKVYNFVYSVFMLICKLLLVADLCLIWQCSPQRLPSRETHISE